MTPRTGDAAVARPVVEFVRAVNAGDVEAAVTWLAPDAVHHARVAAYPPDGVRRLFTMLRQVFPDLHLDIRKQEVQGNRVVSRIVATGTHRGSYLGRPPTGEPVRWESVDVADVEEPTPTAGAGESGHRRVTARHWDLWNDPELFRRLGHVAG